MEESASTGHQSQRKRSSYNNAFAKFVPISPPLGHHHPKSPDEANPGGHHDHSHKRLKPNSEATFSETTTNFFISSPLPKQNIGTSGALDYSSPSTSIKHSASSGPSPQSIGSKSSQIEYVKNDEKVGKTISPSEF